MRNAQIAGVFRKATPTTHFFPFRRPSRTSIRWWLSNVRPAVHEKIRVGLHFREFDPRVGLECVPKVAAAIAHELHFGLVFFVARNEFAPIVLQAEFLDQQVVRKRAVMRQFRPE